MASPSPSPSASSAPSPTPAAGDLPVTPVPFSCRLPVLRRTAAGYNDSFQGAFVTFPAATLANDPAGVFQPSSVLTTAASPVLKGVPLLGVPSYDAAMKRWVPVNSAQLSPDGTSYAYGVNNSAIDVVTVHDGHDRPINVTTPADTGGGFVVENFDGTNAYFGIGSIRGLPYGVWRMDVVQGTTKAMVQILDVFAVRDGKAWIGYLDPHDATPPQGQGFDSIVEVDLSSGARTTWFYRPGQSVRLLAVDGSGRPVVAANSGPDVFVVSGDIRRLDEPLSGGENPGEPIYDGSMSFNLPQVDGDRIWFGNERGIYLYTAAAGFQKVMAFKANAASGETLIPAGGCQ